MCFLALFPEQRGEGECGAIEIAMYLFWRIVVRRFNCGKKVIIERRNS